MCEILDIFEARGKERGEKNAILQMIKNLMETSKESLEAAMNSLKIAEEEKDIYRKMMQQ